MITNNTLKLLILSGRLNVDVFLWCIYTNMDIVVSSVLTYLYKYGYGFLTVDVWLGLLTSAEDVLGAGRRLPFQLR